MACSAARNKVRQGRAKVRRLGLVRGGFVQGILTPVERPRGFFVIVFRLSHMLWWLLWVWHGLRVCLECRRSWFDVVGVLAAVEIYLS